MTDCTKANFLAVGACLLAACIMYFTIAGGGIDRILFDSEAQIELYKEAVK
jgi:hypothetical protein